MNDLRQSLRAELELSAVQETVVYLRFGGSDAVRFDQTLSATIRSVDAAKVEGAAIATPSSRKLLDQREHLGEHAAQIAGVWDELENMIRTRLHTVDGPDLSNLGATALLDLALRSGTITDVQHRSLRGLNAMRNLAVHGRQQDVDGERAGEFFALAEAMKVVLDITDDRRGRDS